MYTNVWVFAPPSCSEEAKKESRKMKNSKGFPLNERKKLWKAIQFEHAKLSIFFYSILVECWISIYTFGHQCKWWIYLNIYVYILYCGCRKNCQTHVSRSITLYQKCSALLSFAAYKTGLLRCQRWPLQLKKDWKERQEEQ